MRQDYVLKNIKYAGITYFITYLLKFLLRTAFVIALPIEYLGINSLLSDVIILLSVTEMGIGTAIGYSLYKPLNEKDIYTIKAIMNVLKKAYYCIGSFILIFGLGITPFLDFFVKNNTILELKYYFILFLLTDALGYFFSYKWILLIADQKQFIYNYYHCIFLSILTILQIFFLLVTKSYWSFIFLMFGIRLVENFYISKKTENLYPYLKELGNEKIDKDIKISIIKNTGALILNKMAIIINSTSANIIISKYIGIAVVGLYSNYMLIVNAIEAFCTQIFKGLVASIGNMLIGDYKENKLRNFTFTFFISAWIACFIINFMFIGLNDFIFLWLGSKFVMDKHIIFCILLMFYINYMQNIVRTFKESAGLYWHERYRPVVESFFNIFLSICLIKDYGIIGVLIGNIISRLLTSFWIEPYILFKYALPLTLKSYFKNYLKYTFIILIVVLINKLVFDYWTVDITIVFLFFKLLIVFIIANVVWFLIFKNTKEMHYLKSFLKSNF